MVPLRGHGHGHDDDGHDRGHGEHDRGYALHKHVRQCLDGRGGVRGHVLREIFQGLHVKVPRTMVPVILTRTLLAWFNRNRSSEG